MDVRTPSAAEMRTLATWADKILPEVKAWKVADVWMLSEVKATMTRIVMPLKS
jgi:hypothetical protein